MNYEILPELDCTEEEIRLGQEYAAAFDEASLRNAVAMKNANYRCRNRQLITAIAALTEAQAIISKLEEQLAASETVKKICEQRAEITHLQELGGMQAGQILQLTAALREVRGQEFISDTAWESKECRRWIKKVDALLGAQNELMAKEAK